MDLRRLDPFASLCAARATGACVLLMLAAAVGASVRLLPWALDPQIPWPTLRPFAKSLLALGIEAALWVGWPTGWALATQRLLERDEARVLRSLGESSARTLSRLAPQALLLTGLLMAASVSLARDARAPGRIVNALLAEGQAACGGAVTTGRAVPLVGASWLCGKVPRLVGRAPVGTLVFAAREARVADDLRRIELEDAELLSLLPDDSDKPRVRVQVNALTLKGLAPFAQSSALPPALRACIVVLSALLSAFGASFGLLRFVRQDVGRIPSAAVGASGPAAALVTLRALELRVPEEASTAVLAVFAAVPLASILAVALSVGFAGSILPRLLDPASRPRWARVGGTTQAPGDRGPPPAA